MKTIIRVESNNANIFKIKIAITKLTSNSHNESDWSIEKILSKKGNTKPASEPTRVAEQAIFIIDPNGLCQNFIALPNLQTNGSKPYSIPVDNAAGGGTRTHTSFQTTDFKSPKAHSPSGNVHLVNSFISDRRLRGLTSRTLQFYEGYLTRFVNTVGVPLLDICKGDIATFLSSLDCNAGGKHAYFRVLRAFYRWACQEELLVNNPMVNMKAPKVPAPLRHAVALDAIPVLLAACENLREKLIVSLLADTGLRLSELASLRAGDIDLPVSSITVWGKGAKERKVCFGPSTKLLLEKHIDAYSPTDRLLGLKPNGVARVLTSLESLTGIRCNAHSFRRTFATESVRNGMNLFHVQSLLGHSSLTMTRIYAEQVNSEDAIKAYKAVVR